MAPHPVQVRHLQARRAAVRAALAGVRLDPKQLKLVLAAHDALAAKNIALTKQSGDVLARTNGASEDRVFAGAGRRMDQIIAQGEDVLQRLRKLGAHPQVHAVIVAREEKEERKS